MRYLALSKGVCGIYAILNTMNGKVYVGSAVDIKARWMRHVHRLRLGMHTNPILQAAWNKHGEDAFEFEVLEEVPDRIWLFIREQLWLNDVRPWERSEGYNILRTADSRLGYIPSEEQKQKQRAAMLGRKTGPISEAQRKVLSEAHKGKPWTNKQRNANRSRGYITTDWRKANSERTAGKSNPFYGKTHSPELLPVVRKNAALGRHVRWHLNRGVSNPVCELCLGVS